MGAHDLKLNKVPLFGCTYWKYCISIAANRENKKYAKTRN